MDSFVKYEEDKWRTDHTKRTITKTTGGLWDWRTAYGIDCSRLLAKCNQFASFYVTTGAIAIRCDGKHNGIHQYEFRVVTTLGALFFGIDNGRTFTHKGNVTIYFVHIHCHIIRRLTDYEYSLL